MIREIHLERFKKFDDVKVQFSPFTVLMGENSSGKTTIIQALNLALLSLNTFDFISIDNKNVRIRPKGVGLTKLPGIELSDFRELYFSKISRSSRGKGTVGANIILTDSHENKYRLQVTSLFGGFNIKCNSTEDELNNNPLIHTKPPLFISGFVGLSPVEERVFPAALIDRLRSGHVSTIIRNLVFDTKKNTPEKYERLKNRLAKDFDFHLEKILFDEQNDLFVTAQYSEVCRDSNLSFDFNSSGSGFMQVLQILAPIYRFCPDDSSIVLLDEPDAHLHTNLQTTLANSLRKIQQELSIQIITSTHSTAIIRAASPREVVPISSTSILCRPLTNRTDIEEEIRSKIDSYNLAKSVISGKLIFFEDADLSIWEELDDLLSTRVFKGAATSPIIRGRGKTDRVPFQIKDIIKEITGEEIKIIFVRDGDGIPPVWRNRVLEYAKKRMVNLHILEYFEIESYLLKAAVIRRALEKKYNSANLPTENDIIKKINALLKESISLARFHYDAGLEDELYQLGLLMNLSEYRNPQTIKSEVRAWHDKLETIDDTDELLRYGMGKESLNGLLRWLNEGLNYNLGRLEIIEQMTLVDIPQEISDLLTSLKSDEQRGIPEDFECFAEEDDSEEMEIKVEQLMLNFGDRE